MLPHQLLDCCRPVLYHLIAQNLKNRFPRCAMM